MSGDRPVPASSFTFDEVFGPESTNEGVYASVARKVVQSTVNGFNGVIFAYGQTSSGKTHTMMGTSEDPGVTPRAVYDLFEMICKCPERNFLLRVSYVEIYNEVIRDLLAPANDNLKIHEDFDGKVFVEAQEHVVSSVEEVMAVMRAGEEQRTFGATNMNDRSSRSHTIFTVRIQSWIQKDESIVNEEGTVARVSSLSLVDLAGSERVSLTGAEGVRLKEGSHINKSLLTLGTVINKLSDGGTGHVPYRDSKLTRVLQNALGGNAKTSIIAAVTPAPIHFEETNSTLTFAKRAKNVTNKAHCNEILSERAVIFRQKKEIERLKALLEGTEFTGDRDAPGSDNRVRTDREVSLLQAKVEKLTEIIRVSENLRYPSENGASRRGHKRRFSIAREHGTCVETRGPASDSNPRDALHDQIRSLSANIIQAKNEERKAKEELSTQSRQMKFEFDGLRSEISLLESEAETFQKDARQAQMELEMFIQERTYHVMSSVTDSLVEKAIDQSLLRKAQSEISRVALDLTQAEKTLADKDAELRDRRREISEFVRREKQGIGPVMKEANSLRSKVQDLEAKLRSTRQLNAQMEGEKSQVERENRILQKQVKSIDVELGKAKETAARVREMITEKQTAEKLAEKARKELNSAHEEVAAKQAMISELDSSKKQLVEQIGALERQVTALEAKCISLEAEREESVAQCAVLREDSSRRGDEIESLRLQLSGSQLESKELKSTLEEANRTLARLASDSERSALENRSLLADVASLRDQLHRSVSECTSVSEERARLEQVVSKSEEANRKFIEERETQAEEIDLLKATIATLESQITEAVFQAQSLSDRVHEVELKLHAKTEKVEDLEREIQRESTRNSDLEEERAQLLICIEDLRSTTLENVQKFENLKTELGQKSEELEDTKRVLFKKEEALTTMASGIQGLEGSVSDLRTKEAELEHQNLRLREEVSRLENAFDRAKSEDTGRCAEDRERLSKTLLRLSEVEDNLSRSMSLIRKRDSTIEALREEHFDEVNHLRLVAKKLKRDLERRTRQLDLLQHRTESEFEAAAKEADLEALRAELAHAQSSLANNRDESGQLRRENTKLRDLMKGKDEDMLVLQGKLHEMEARLVLLQATGVGEPDSSRGIKEKRRHLASANRPPLIPLDPASLP